MSGRSPGVLIVVQNMSFSYDTRVQNIARTLTGAGYRVRVLCPRYRGDPRTAEIEGVHVRFIRWPELGPGLLAHVVEYACSVLVLSVHVLGAVVREHVEVIHVCNPPDLFFGLSALLRVAGKAVVFDQHDSWPELFAARGARPTLCHVASWCTRASIAAAHQTIVTSESALPTARSRGACERRTLVVQNGVRIEAMPEAETEVPGLVGYLGNMNPQDGLDELLETARAIRYDFERPDICFLVIGDGTSWPAVRAGVSSLGLDGSVTLTGRLPPTEAWRLLARCTICVQPDPPNAFTDMSVMAKSLEYMALGKALAAFDLAETRRVCGDAALYAARADSRSLAACIITLLDDPTLRAALARRGRQRVAELFAWGRSEQVLLEAYARLTVSRRRSLGERGRLARAGTPDRPP
jgi:glycosyltransferase involved in cell wall biosynthesis